MKSDIVLFIITLMNVCYSGVEKSENFFFFSVNVMMIKEGQDGRVTDKFDSLCLNELLWCLCAWFYYFTKELKKK